MPQITGELDLSNIESGKLDKEMNLRVALVQGGEVIASTSIKSSARSAKFQLSTDDDKRKNAKLAAVQLIVGPDVDDEDLLSLDLVKHEVDLRQKTAANRPARGLSLVKAVDIGRLVIPEPIYLRWLILCRTYVITGRVVCRQWHYNPQTQQWTFCDAPVPGARVEAFDVDCFLWWCRRDFVTSAVTDMDGNFTIKFRWCCVRRLPWLYPNWTIDPDIFKQIRDLLVQTRIPLPPVPPSPDPIFLQKLVAQLGGNQSVSLASRSVANATGIIDSPASAEVFRKALPLTPGLSKLQIWPWWDRRDCAPDLIFRVTQVCDGQLRIIHNETVAQTRWNIPTTLNNVVLLANDEACCLPACRDPEMPECLTLSWVGCTPTGQIGDSGDPAQLRGYAGVATSDDKPFFGALRIRGGTGWDVDYFRVEMSKDGGPWVEMPEPVFAGFARAYWDGASFVPAPGPAFVPIVKNGKTVMVTRRHYEDLHPAIPRFGGTVHWNDYDTLFIFDTWDDAAQTGLVADGLYELRFVGYATNAADDLLPDSERVLPLCGQDDEARLFIRIDNQSQLPHIVPGVPCTAIHACIAEPDCYIRSVCVNEGMPDAHCILPCEIVRLSASDTLTIHFTVTVPNTVEDGHLGGYYMQAHYGLSNVFDIGTGVHGTFASDPTFEVGPTYAAALAQGAPRPHWYGGDYKVTLRGTDFPECCAYLLHLRAWKRTTNGCTDPQYVHYNRFEMSFTVLRRELCPDVCGEIA